MNDGARPHTSEVRVRFGWAVFAAGLMVLVYAGMARLDGRLTHGSRGGPVETIEREASPRRFDQYTNGFLTMGAVMTVGGLGLVLYSARSRRSRPTGNDRR